MLSRKIGNNEYLVHLHQLNKFIIVDKQNLLVIKSFINLTKTEFDKFLELNYKELSSSIKDNLRELFKIPKKDKEHQIFNNKKSKNKETFSFTLSNINYQIEYDNFKIISSVLGLLNHLKSKNKFNSQKILVQSNSKFSCLSLSNKKYIFKTIDSHILSGKIISFLTSQFHKIKYGLWAGFLHGTTVEKNNKGVLIVGKSGSGKTISSSILIQNGFNLIADDMSPLTREGYIAHFPNAMSIKKSGFNKVKKIIKNDFYVFETLGPKGTTRYIYPSLNKAVKLKTKCNIIVKIEYVKNSQFTLDQISHKEILPHFLDDSYVNNKKISAKSFMNWFVNSKCYKLKYSKDFDLVNGLDELF